MPSLYVHVPFCLQKCDYCAFYSHSLKDSPSELTALYLEGLELEMAARHKDAPEGVSSLFIGGGTPTALSAGNLERLLELISRYFAQAYTKDAEETGKKSVGQVMAKDAEKDEGAALSQIRMRFRIWDSKAKGAEKDKGSDAGSVEDDGSTLERTAEGNPGTLTPEKLTILRNHGINRFSLGVQTFDDQLLAGIGRIHTAQQARAGIRLLREAGFRNLNLDLMFGLPKQDMKTWQRTVEEALSFRPEHLSLYGLMLEEGTPLHRRFCGDSGKDSGRDSESLPGDDLQAEMQEWAVSRLTKAGYIYYETSNFALPGYECRHNLGYWHGEDYLGLGPGGVSCLKRIRSKNVEDVPDYQASLARGEMPLNAEGPEILSLQDCMAERMILGLRLREGVNFTKFREDFGVDLRDIYKDVLERYKRTDVFLIKGDNLCLNPKYAFVSNAALQEFV